MTQKGTLVKAVDDDFSYIGIVVGTMQKKKQGGWGSWVPVIIDGEVGPSLWPTSCLKVVKEIELVVSSEKCGNCPCLGKNSGEYFCKRFSSCWKPDGTKPAPTRIYPDCQLS